MCHAGAERFQTPSRAQFATIPGPPKSGRGAPDSRSLNFDSYPTANDKNGKPVSDYTQPIQAAASEV